MNVFLQVKINPTFQAVNRRFKAAQKKQVDRRRETAREIGRQLIVLVREEAPGKGSFAKKHIFRTFDSEDRVSLKVYAPNPLSRYIRFGTKPHGIAAKNARALAFFWPKVGMQVFVPKGGGFKTHVSNNVLWIGKGRVWHPGTKPNDYLGRAFRRWRPSAIISLRKLGSQFIMDFKGQ